MKKIEILGTGCSKCKRLEKNVRKAVNELDVEAEIEKVEKIEDISARGVMVTPALSIDGEMKASGEVPSSKKIKELLSG